MKNETTKRIFSSLIMLPIALFFIYKGSIYFIFFLSISLLIGVFEWNHIAKKKSYLILGIIFLILSFFSAYLLRGQTDKQLFVFLSVILICISTDIGGYIFGKLFKGPKLTKISPNKTIAGSIGGFFLSITICFIFSKNLEITMTIGSYFIIILISLISQLGDIVISYFKRLAKVKNTGKLLPGHGGLLDRADGMIFAIPFTYLLKIALNL